MKIKYRDAKYLCKYNLESEFFENIGLNIKDLWPTRNIYVLDTTEGKKILKMVNYEEEKLNFIIKGLSYISKSYDKVIKYHQFKDGNYYIDWKGNRYIILDLIDGIECNVYNPLDIFKSTKALGELHKASEGIENIISAMDFKRSNLGNLQKEFGEGKERLLNYKKRIEEKEYKNEFDKLYIANLDYFLDRANLAIELLKNSSYKKLCNESNNIVLCHNDLAYHNILINEDNVYFIDFDYCSIDLKVVDIYSFVSKVSKKTGFDYDEYIEILNNYRKVISFSNEEENLLQIMFLYPKGFLNVSDNYYLGRKDWAYDSYLNKLKEKINYKKEENILFEKFKIR